MTTPVLGLATREGSGEGQGILCPEATASFAMCRSLTLAACASGCTEHWAAGPLCGLSLGNS